MFWKKPAKKIKPRPKSTLGDPNSPVKPSPRREKKREKRIELQLNCFVFVIDTEQIVQCKTINVSKTGMLLKSIHALANGQDVICVFSNKKSMSRPAIQTNPNAMKGKVVRVEKEPFMFKIAIDVTFGRVDPTAILDINTEFVKYWWSRHWS